MSAVSLAGRFWPKVLKRGPDRCWLWRGSKDSRTGYGFFRAHGRRRSATGAHRVAWELVNGPVPDGLLVCHSCDTPLCCNPAHLFVGTQTDNMRDASAKGRLARRSA